MFFPSLDHDQATNGGDDNAETDCCTVQNGAPVDDPRFFTTLENTPIDFFILGTEARQGYEADTCVCVCVRACMRASFVVDLFRINAVLSFARVISVLVPG